MLSGKAAEAGTSSGSESSRRVSRKSATNSTRAKTPPSPRLSLAEGALAPISRGRPSMSPRKSAENNGHDDLMEILTKQRDNVAREGVDAYIHQRRVTSGRSPMTAGSIAIDAIKQKKSITDSYESIVVPRSQKSVGSLSARRAQSKNSAPVEEITLSVPDKKKKSADDSIDFDDSNLGDLGDLDDLLSSAPASARKSPRAKRGGSTLGSPADGDLTQIATRMLEGAFPISPRQPSSLTPKARSPSASAPVGWSPRPGVDSISSFPDSASTWGTLASAAASPAPSARRQTGSISPQSTRLPSISAAKITPVAPTGVTSSRRPPAGDNKDNSPSPTSAKPPTVTSSRSPAGSNPTAATTTTTSSSTKTPRQEKPPTSEKPPLSSRKSVAQPTSGKVSSSAKKQQQQVPPASPKPPTTEKRLPSLSAERSPNKDDALGGTVAPKNDNSDPSSAKKPTALSPRLPSESKENKSATDKTPKVSARKNSARVTSVVISDDKTPTPVAVTSGRKQTITEIIPAETLSAPPASKPPLKGAASKSAAPGAKGARKSVAPTASKAAPAAPAAGKKSTTGSRKPSVADIALQKRGSRAPSLSDTLTTTAASPGARKSVTSVGGDATLADLLWGDSLYATDPVPLPISSSDFTDSTIPTTTFYPIPYLQKLDEIRTRVRVSNEQGKFTDDELKRVQGWEVIGDDLKEAVARCIEELISKELSHKEERGGGGGTSSSSKHKLVLWDVTSKKPFKSARGSGGVGGATAPAPAPKGKASKPPAKAATPAASSGSTAALDALVGKLGDDYTATGLDSRILRLSEKAVKMEAIEVAAIASLQGPSPYYRKDPLLLPTKSVQEDDEKFGNILRALAGFDSDALRNAVVVDRKNSTALSASSEDESIEYFKDQFYELTVVGDGKKGNLRLVKAILQASVLGMVVSSSGGKSSAQPISLRECCEERGIVASSISDGSMEFIPELLLQYVLGEEHKPITEDGDENDDDDEDFTLDMYDVFTSAMFQQQYRIPLVEILMDLLIIPPPGKARTPAQQQSLSGQNKLFRELMKIKGELKDTWIEFFHDICDVKKAIPRELRGRRIHLVRKMLGLQDVAVVAASSGALMPSPSGMASSIKVASAAQHWLNKWTPSSTSSVLALRAILQGNDASPEVGPTTGKSLISATTRFWKYLLQGPSSSSSLPTLATASVDSAPPIFVFGPWDLELWKTHGDGYDVLSRAARDNDVDLLPALQEGLERLPPSWAVTMLLPKSSQAIIKSTGTVNVPATAVDGDDDEDDGGDATEIEAKWPLELYVGIEFDEDAIEDIRNDFATAETASIPPASLASYYRAIYLPPTVSPIPYNGPFVAPSRIGTSKKDARIATLFDQLILKRGRDDMTPLFTAALGNAGLAVSWILDTLDHLPNHTTFADKQKPGASTRWLAVEMVQLPCQIEGLGSSLDMCTALNKDDAVVVSLEEFATMED